MNDKFTEMLARLCARPGLYVGTPSLDAVAHFLRGYDFALSDSGIEETPLAGWLRWVELRFNICDPAWSWTTILQHAYGSEAEAIKALPQLYAEFSSERNQIGLGKILSNWETEFGSFPSRTPD